MCVQITVVCANVCETVSPTSTISEREVRKVGYKMKGCGIGLHTYLDGVNG